MRFVWAVAAFVLAALLFGLGIAQRTVLLGPQTESLDVPVAADTNYVLVDGAVLGQADGTQTISARGDGTVFLSYGRTADMQAWLSDEDYEWVTLDDEGEVQSETVAATYVPADETASDTAEEGGESETDASAEPAADPVASFRNPAGSDLWLAELTGDGRVSTSLQLPETMSVLLASDGQTPAPQSVTVTWRVPNATPWAGPLMVLGGIALLAGIVLYILAIRHNRRSKGPRRKAPPPLPPTEPIDISGAGEQDGVSAPTTRRSLGSRRRLIVVPIALVGILGVTACSPEAWPDFASTPTPTPTATVLDAADAQQPAVTEPQAREIMARVADTVTQADAANDAAMAATRLGGAALAERETNYTLRSNIEGYASLTAIDAEPLEIILPQAINDWPRSFLAVAQSDEGDTTTSTIMMLTQADPWSEYKLQYVANLDGSTELPRLAPAYIGAAQVPPDSSFLVLAPDDLAAAYADILTNGENSSFAALFDEGEDGFAARVSEDRQRRLDEFNATGAETGTLEFSANGGSTEPLALATVDSGAIVAVTVTETDTVKPASDDVVIKLDGNETVQTLTGTSESSTGVTTTFIDQLFFYVPAQASGEKIRLLASNSHILEAKVIE